MGIETESFEDALSVLEAILAPDRLSDLQALIVRNCWDGYTYRQIAESSGYDDDYIRDVGFQLWRRLSKSLNTKVSKSNFKTALRHYASRMIAPSSANRQYPANPVTPRIVDWGTAAEIPHFFGRDRELTTLNQWLQSDRSRIVTILGIGGMGKSALALRFAQQIASEFDIVLWQSLKTAPPLSELADHLLKRMNPSPDIVLPFSLTDKLECLVQTLRQKRCAIILDNLDVLLASDREYGNFQPNYAAYRDVLRQIGEIGHRSCIIITSREKPHVIDALERADFPVRTLCLEGLDAIASMKVISHKGVKGSPPEIQELIDYYRGHPLALKIVSASIQNLFDGSIGLFLQQGCDVFNGLQKLLPQQLERLSSLEIAILYWLAIAQEPIAIRQLQNDLIPTPSSTVLFQALENLKQRSLIETAFPDSSIRPELHQAIAFTLQPAIADYLIQTLIETIVREIVDRKPQTFLSHALIKAQIEENLRDRQARLILTPLTTRLLNSLGSETALTQHLQSVLKFLQTLSTHQVGYGGGNLLNLFRHLKTDLTGYDFSGLTLRQAILHDVSLRRTNFSHVTFHQCSFANTFGGITSIAFSPDGQQFATCDTNGNVALWSVAGMHPIAKCIGHDFWTWAVAFSPDSKLLASCGQDQTVRLWDTTIGHCYKILQGHISIVLDVTFSPDGTCLLSSSNDGSIKQWDAASGDCLHTFVGHEKCVWGVVFAPDGQHFYSGGEDLTIRYWDLATGDCLNVFTGHTHWIMAIALSPDGLLLASASIDGTLKLWCTATGNCLYTMMGHQGPAVSVAFSPDGRTLASGSYDQTVRLWHTRTGSCTQRLQKHTNRIWCVKYHPKGTLLASGGDDNTTRFWNPHTGDATTTLQGHSNGIYGIALHPTLPLLASAHEDQTVRLWQIPDQPTVTDQPLEPSHTLRGHQNRILAIAYSPDGQILASGSLDRTIKLWHPTTHQCRLTLQGHQSWIWDIAFHPNSQTLASASYDRTIKLWDLETGHCTHTLEGHLGSALSVGFSHDGQWLASGGYEQMLKLWRFPSGECVRTWTAHPNRIWSVTFSPDSQTLATAGEDGHIMLWDVETGDRLQTLSGHSQSVLCIRFSADGHQLFSSSSDRTIKQWDLVTGQCLQTFGGHNHWVWSIALATPDQMFSGSQDETIQCWNPATGQAIQQLEVQRPYTDMAIVGAKGLTKAQHQTLTVLGAINFV